MIGRSTSLTRILSAMAIGIIGIVSVLFAFALVLFPPLALPILGLGVLLVTGAWKILRGASITRWLLAYPMILAGLSTALVWGASFVEFGIYEKVNSPDGMHFAIASPDLVSAFTFGAPGGSGDKSGWISVYSKSGEYMGRHRVQMVQFIYDIRWDKNEAYLGFGENISWPFRKP